MMFEGGVRERLLAQVASWEVKGSLYGGSGREEAVVDLEGLDSGDGAPGEEKMRDASRTGMLVLQGGEALAFDWGWGGCEGIKSLTIKSSTLVALDLSGFASLRTLNVSRCPLLRSVAGCASLQPLVSVTVSCCGVVEMEGVETAAVDLSFNR